MPFKLNDITGNHYGRLTVVSFSRTSKNNHRMSYWNCVCDCSPDKIIEKSWTEIFHRKYPSCGCMEEECAPRTTTYNISGNFGIATMSNGLCFYFDIEDYDKIKYHSWACNDNKYIRTKIKEKNIYLSRHIMNCPKGLYVDHIDGNVFDNRKCNLRIVTNQENNRAYKRKQKGTSSKYFGVVFLKNKDKKPWRAGLGYNGKFFYLGVYDTEEEAALAYNKKAEELGFFRRNILPKELPEDAL